MLLLLALLAAARAAPLDVGVDPRVELLAVMMRLTGAEEYTRATSGYARAADAWFAPYRDERAIRRLAALRRERGISYDAPMALAVHLDPESLEPLIPLRPWPSRLDRRWSPGSVGRFTGALRRFAEQARFSEFLASQADYIAKVEASFRGYLAERDVVGWFDAFFGAQSDAQYRVIPGLLTGPSNYGVSMERADGTVLYSPVLGVGRSPEGIPPMDEDIDLLLVHELGHGYVHPLLAAPPAELLAAAEAANARVAAAMQEQAYGSAETLLSETLVRAVSYLYARDRLGSQIAADHLAYQQGSSFYWTAEVAAALDAHRGDPAAALPAIGDTLARWAEAPWYPSFNGPINAAFQGPWRPERMAVIAPLPGDTPAGQRALEYVQAMHRRFYAADGGGVPLLPASEPLPAAPRALVLYGTPASNPHLAALLGRLGWSVAADGVSLGERRFAGERLALIACAPHPDDPTLPVLVYAAAADEDIPGINAVFHGPTDWVVARRADGAAEIVAQGDFPAPSP